MPMFTSCCPGLDPLREDAVPTAGSSSCPAPNRPSRCLAQYRRHISRRYIGVDPSRLFCVSIMPCVAKKHEADIPTINAAEKGKDVDCVLTTRELARMIRADRIVVGALQEEPFDQPLGLGTGAGEIFGVTGGVMEAALRSAYYLITGKNPEPDSFREIRGQEPWRESELNMGGTRVRVAAVSGLGNTRKLIEKILRGEKHYDFVEVMACPGGCVGGGGQPIHDGEELASVRGEALYRLDKKNPLRFSHENPCVQQLYKEYLGEPLSEKAHELLHTDHNSWHMPGEYKE